MRAFWAVLLIFALSGCYEDKMRKQFKERGCTPTGRVELPEKVYCGKACFRHKVRETFICGGVTESFDH